VLPIFIAARMMLSLSRCCKSNGCTAAWRVMQLRYWPKYCSHA